MVAMSLPLCYVPLFYALLFYAPLSHVPYDFRGTPHIGNGVGVGDEFTQTSLKGALYDFIALVKVHFGALVLAQGHRPVESKKLDRWYVIKFFFLW